MKKKEKVAGIIKKAAAFVCAASMMFLMPLSVKANNKKPATGSEAVTTSLSSFYAIVSAFVSSVGAMILLWGVFEWGTSMQSNDGSMQANAFKRIGGGLVMIIAPQIIAGFIS